MICMHAGAIAKSHHGRRAGSGYVCRCPVPSHGRGRGDRTPSLSISNGEDGKLLVHCHAGCDPRDVLEALYIADESGSSGESRLFGEKPQPNYAKHAGPEHAKRFLDSGLIVAGYTFACAYDYTTEDDTLLYQVLRYEHPTKQKEFLQRRPDGHGGWLGSAGDRKVLYRWRDLRKVAHDTVFVCEGEKTPTKV